MVCFTFFFPTVDDCQLLTVKHQLSTVKKHLSFSFIFNSKVYIHSRTGQCDDFLEWLSSCATKLNDWQSFPDLLDAGARLEENVVRRVHPRDDVTLTTVDSRQGGNATLGENLDRSTCKKINFRSQNDSNNHISSH